MLTTPAWVLDSSTVRGPDHISEGLCLNLSLCLDLCLSLSLALFLLPGMGSGRLQGRDGGGSMRTFHSAPDGDTGELQLWLHVGWWSEMEGAEKLVPA